VELLKWRGALCFVLMILLAGSLFTGCGGDSDGGPDLIVLADFEGSWGAEAYRITSAADSQITVELIGMGGGFAWDADENGQMTGRAFVPAALAGASLEMPFQGSFELVSQESIRVSFNPEYPPFLTETRASFTLAGNIFTIRDDNTEFDFDGDQVMEPAIFTGRMVRYPGGTPPVVFVEDLEGQWEAQEYRVTSIAEPQRTMELIGLGATFGFDSDDQGAFLADMFIPAAIAGEDISITDSPGLFTLVTQDTMLTSFTPEIPPFLEDIRGPFTLAGDTLSVADENSMFDFGQGQGAEPAVFEGMVVRTTK